MCARLQVQVTMDKILGDAKVSILSVPCTLDLSKDLCSLNASLACKQAQPNAQHQPDEWTIDLFLLPYKPLIGVHEPF